MKKNHLYLTSAIILLTSLTVISCKKDATDSVIYHDNVTNNTSLSKSATNATPIASYCLSTGELTHNYTITTIRQDLENELLKRYGKIVVIDKLKIVFDSTDINHPSYLSLSYYDPDSEETIASAFELDTEMPTPDTIVYKLAGRKRYSIQCIGHGCQQGECIEMYDRSGTAYDCTTCPVIALSNGFTVYCEKRITHTEEGLDWSQILAAVLEGIVSAGLSSKI